MPSKKGGTPAPRGHHFQFAFTKVQLVLLAFALAGIVGLSFGLGVTVTQREAERRAGPGAAESSRYGLEDAARPPRRTRVPLPPAEEEKTAAAEPDFYKTLVKKRPPGHRVLSPIPLPEGGKLPEPPSRNAAGSPGVKAFGAAGGPGASAENGAGRGGIPPENGLSARAETSAGDGYTVQLLSVRRRARAEEAVRNLSRMGFQAVVVQADLKEKGVWHRVRVGRYPDRASAERALAELRVKTPFKKGRILPL